MVKILESSVLKDMTLLDLKKHAKSLRKGGYPISGYSKLSDTKENMSILRKMIRNAQKSGKKCNHGFENVTACQKKTSVKKVKEIAEECGITYTNKEKVCKELIKSGQKGNGDSKKKTPPKKPINLNRLPKTELQDQAKELGIEYGEQDGENIRMIKLRKQDLIIAIIKKTQTSPKRSKKRSKKKSQTPKRSKKRSKKTPTPPKRSRKRSKKKTPTPPKRSKKRSKKKTPTPPKRSRKTHTSPKRSKKRSKRKTPTPPKRSKTKITTPPKKSRRRRSVKISHPKKKCAGKRYKTLMKMDPKELRTYMHSAGLKTGLPKTKLGMVDYLCAIEENGRCDPEEGKWCNGEFICDVSNKPGVCVSPSQSSHHSGANMWEYKGKKLIGTSKALDSLKKALYVKGKKGSKLVNKISLVTGMPKSHYKDWSIKDLEDRLYGIEVGDGQFLTKTIEQSKLDELNARRVIINDIIAITKEKASDYKGYDFDEVMDILHKLRDEDDVIEDTDNDRNSMINAIIAITKEKASEYKGYNLDEVMDRLQQVRNEDGKQGDSSDEDSSDEDSSDKKKIPESSESSESSESDSSDEDSDRPEEETEIVDIESTLANVIESQKKIGELAKVQQSVLKCMGILS